MYPELSNFAARLRELIALSPSVLSPGHFSDLALELFALQFKHNAAYRAICEARRLPPQAVEDWTQIPAVPTAAFKALELSCIPPVERTAVFHSSGTTEQKPSRHYHHTESLAVYEASVWGGFQRNFFAASAFRLPPSAMLFLTPPPAQAPRSSLVHMFETVRRRLGAAEPAFVGTLATDGSWALDFAALADALSSGSQNPDARPWFLLGTAFSFVHLADHLAEKKLQFHLPKGSRVMETGGYKNRSRSLPKAELHALITERLGVPRENIICEYGMSELSSQAYDNGARGTGREALGDTTSRRAPTAPPCFHFPPWARVQIISPETGSEVAEGETGLVRVFDLANVFSVAAIQTEDLGIRRGDGFELLGRAQQAEPRGCSLMSWQSPDRQ